MESFEMKAISGLFLGLFIFFCLHWLGFANAAGIIAGAMICLLFLTSAVLWVVEAKTDKNEQAQGVKIMFGELYSPNRDGEIRFVEYTDYTKVSEASEAFKPRYL